MKIQKLYNLKHYNFSLILHAGNTKFKLKRIPRKYYDYKLKLVTYTIKVKRNGLSLNKQNDCNTITRVSRASY